MSWGSAQAQTTYFPGATEFGTALFEDLWPCEGDFDFNDAVIRYHYRRDEAAGLTTEIVLNLSVHALGASQCNGVALRLPVPAGNLGTVRRKLGTAGAVDGIPWGPAEPVEVTVTDGEPVIWISPNLREELCGGVNGFLNTVEGQPITACKPLAIEIPFTTGTVVPPEEPYDLFVYGCTDRTKQLHRSEYSGLENGPYAANSSLYGTCDDDSLATPGKWYHANGIPFALNLGEGILGGPGDGQGKWPSERSRIDIAMPDIVQFAAGNGAYDFYRDDKVVGAFMFHPPLPPTPITNFDGSTEADLCVAESGTWTGSTCDCSPRGAGYTWDGALCQLTSNPEETACTNAGASWNGTACDCSGFGAAYVWTNPTCHLDDALACQGGGGTWTGSACDCTGYGATYLWSGSSCYDGGYAPQQALKCVNGGTSATGQSFTGGGTWTGSTCDCSSVGLGYYWNGNGCFDPTGGVEAACESSGGNWLGYDPQGNSHHGSSFLNGGPCDCSAVGAGYRADGGGGCADTTDGAAALCVAQGARWLDTSHGPFGAPYCDCTNMGGGLEWSGSACEPIPSALACSLAGGDWTGVDCNCAAVGYGSRWTGSDCSAGGEAQACQDTGGTWTGSSCDCGSMTWDAGAWVCHDAANAESQCGSWGGIWDYGQSTCDCVDWDGWGCGITLVSTCEMDGGTWVAGMGTCDCAAGEAWHPGLQTCMPYGEYACAVETGGSPHAWTGHSCDCSQSHEPNSSWDGASCTYDPEAEACSLDAHNGNHWDPVHQTCACGGHHGTWDSNLMMCDAHDEQSACNNAGGHWDHNSNTCDCQSVAGWGPNDGMAWDSGVQACVYSPVAHACRLDWGAYGVDPHGHGGGHGNDCFCKANSGHHGHGGYSPQPHDFTWRTDALYCEDNRGGWTCEAEEGGIWTVDPYGHAAEYCDCGSNSGRRWVTSPAFACEASSEVAACDADPAGAWSYSNDTCNCGQIDPHQVYNPWEDPHAIGWTGTECTGAAEQACESEGGVWDSQSHVAETACACPSGEYWNPSSTQCQPYPEFWCTYYNHFGWTGSTCDCGGAPDTYFWWDGAGMASCVTCFPPDVFNPGTGMCDPS